MKRLLMSELAAAIALEAAYQAYRQQHHRLFWTLLYGPSPELYPKQLERTEWLNRRGS